MNYTLALTMRTQAQVLCKETMVSIAASYNKTIAATHRHSFAPLHQDRDPFNVSQVQRFWWLFLLFTPPRCTNQSQIL